MLRRLKKGSGTTMGKVIAPVTVTNVWEPSHRIECEMLVDTGTSALVLPKAWKTRLGEIRFSRPIKMETADQRIAAAEVCGPVQIQIKGFRPVFNEVVFIDMAPRRGRYEPLLGYIILEQSQAAVDMTHHRLKHVPHLDLKMTA